MLMRNPYVAFGAACAFGLGAALFAGHWIQGRAAATEQALNAGSPVVVANAEISFGERIRPGDVKLLTWPQGNVPEGTFGSVDEVVGKFTNQKLLPGEVLLHQRIVQQLAGSSLAGEIEPTMRAVSVRVNDVIGVAGFLLPGNRVDVLGTRMAEDRRAITHTLLQNLKVLAVDQTVQSEKSQPVVVRAVTLEMNPSQAELLVQATQEGTVQLALRNPVDASVMETLPEQAHAAASRNAATAPVRSAQAKKPSQPVITVIRQTRMADAEVKS
jgi:pilus assembly protein CpaB